MFVPLSGADVPRRCFGQLFLTLDLRPAALRLAAPVAAVTLAAETFAVDHFGRVKRFPKTVWVIILANLLSFSAPYLLTYLANAPIYTFAQAVEHLPLFTVGFWYLLLTLGVEGPVVYFCLRRDVREQERLLAVIGLSNLVTTLFVALAERCLCHGSW